MRLNPAEILVLLACALAAVFSFIFHVPLRNFFRLFTDLREGGIHWLTLLLAIEIVLFPSYLLIIQAVANQIVRLRAARQIDLDQRNLELEIFSGWSREWEALLRGLKFFRDWLPLLVFMTIYWTVYSLSDSLRIPPRDALLVNWDLAIFGKHYSVVAQKFYSPFMTACMDFCYFMHVVILPLFLGLLYLKKQYALFDRALLFLLLCMTLGSFGYVFLPAYGPYIYLHDLYAADLFRNPFVAIFVDLTRTPRDAFPSMHVALSFGLLLYQYRYAKWLFWLLLPLVVGNWLSTIYLRYHYTVDLPAGFAVAAVAYWATEKIYARYEAA